MIKRKTNSIPNKRYNSAFWVDYKEWYFMLYWGFHCKKEEIPIDIREEITKPLEYKSLDDNNKL